MACSITITSVTGIPAVPNGTTTSTIHVTGTISGDCDAIVFSPTIKYDVVVQVDCGGGPVDATTLSAGGTWAVDVPAVCACTKNIAVTASCATNSACTDTFSGVLNCQQGGCPTGTLTVSVDGCNPDGTRSVTLTANVTSAPPGSAGQFAYGDGNFSIGVPVNGPGSHSTTYQYLPPGPANPAEFIWIIPSNCPPLTAVVPVLQTCSVVCPNGTVQITASPPGDCNANGTRTVHFDPIVSGVTPQFYHWDFGDGVAQPTNSGSPGPLDYDFPAPGNTATSYTVVLTVTTSNGACIYTATIMVDVLGCAGPPPPPPPPPDGGSTLCGVAALVIGVLAALVLGAVIIGVVATVCLHLPVPSWYWTVVAAAAGVIALVILTSYILCWFGVCPCFTKCDWLKIAWIALLAAAVIALYFGGCCMGWWWLVILGLFAGAGLVLNEWRNECSPTTCAIVLSTVVSLATVAGTLFGFIATLGPLAAALTACAWLWVKVGAAALAGILAAWAAANCTSGP